MKILYAAVLALCILVGCAHHPMRYLPVNDKPLNDAELHWMGPVIANSDSTVVTDSVPSLVRMTRFDKADADGVFRNGTSYDTTIFITNEMSYISSWGKLQVGWSIYWGPEGGYRVNVSIDGVDFVTEPGRWWILIRETLNRLAMQNYIRDAVREGLDRRRWFVQDSTDKVQRLFKLDSTMKAIGR